MWPTSAKNAPTALPAAGALLRPQNKYFPVQKKPLRRGASKSQPCYRLFGCKCGSGLAGATGKTEAQQTQTQQAEHGRLGYSDGVQSDGVQIELFITEHDTNGLTG